MNDEFYHRLLADVERVIKKAGKTLASGRMTPDEYKKLERILDLAQDLLDKVVKGQEIEKDILELKTLGVDLGKIEPPDIPEDGIKVDTVTSTYSGQRLLKQYEEITHIIKRTKDFKRRSFLSRMFGLLKKAVDFCFGKIPKQER
jgi:hypothetical protein